MKIKIFLADDQYLILEGIKAILKHEPEIEIVGTAQDGHSAIAQVLQLQPDLVLIDIEMPKINGIVATKYICENMPDTRVIVLTSHKEPSYISEAFQAGASGYLLKDTLIQDLKQIIHSLARGCAQIETKLLSPIGDRLPRTKIVKYPSKVTYLKKYRKSIYKPILTSSRQKIKLRVARLRPNYQRTLSHNAVNCGISKTTLSPIFDASATQEMLALYQTKFYNQRQKLYSSPRFNRQFYLKKIALMFMAIASFVLSVIVF
jgi:DNA-binding NarL/FixJ family response regulator